MCNNDDYQKNPAKSSSTTSSLSPQSELPDSAVICKIVSSVENTELMSAKDLSALRLISPHDSSFSIIHMDVFVLPRAMRKSFSSSDDALCSVLRVREVI